jgi:hypothetical protein
VHYRLNFGVDAFDLQRCFALWLALNVATMQYLNRICDLLMPLHAPTPCARAVQASASTELIFQLSGKP